MMKEEKMNDGATTTAVAVTTALSCTQYGLAVLIELLNHYRKRWNEICCGWIVK